MRKNPNGYGSVYKLSGNRRRPYIARRTVGWADKPDGTKKQQYQTIGYYASRSEAMKALNEYWRCGIVQADNLTLAKIYEEWSAIHYKTLSDKAINNYTYAFKHMEPLHNARFVDLRKSHWQNLINDCLKVHARESVKKIKTVASMMYKYAIDNDICLKNYAADVTIPAQIKKRKPIFNDIELIMLWENIDKPYADYVLVLAYTGMRIGELLKLTVFDVDLNNMFIHGGSKTEAGTDRSIPIHPEIQDIMRNLVEIGKRQNGKLYPYTYSCFRKHYQSLLTELGIEYKPLHRLRNTFITRMVKNKSNVALLQKIVGHKNITTTIDVYTQLEEKDWADEIKKF